MVFIPYDLEPGKVLTTAVYGGDVVAIEGSYDDVNRLCSELTETDEFEKTAFVNVNLRPFYAEGSKTLGYEVAEQLGWRLPAQVVMPMASGELLTKVDKAFAELVEIGLVEAPAGGGGSSALSRAGCNPIATALRGGTDEIVAGQADRHRQVAQHRRPGRRAATRSSRYAAPAVGWTTPMTTRSAPASGCSPRTTGVFAETAGGVTVAVLRKLIAGGRLDPDAETVVLQHRRGPEDTRRGRGSRSVRLIRFARPCGPRKRLDLIG